ncbi:MAG: hypothetical protein JW839_20115 [Candidatus Lokiarchaeota archaeon]|nr:hypothetical protein [Candidatus Lokiarchaeota archaeon]
MNARERMIAVLRHEQPDTIPFTIYAGTRKLVGLSIYEPWRKLLDKGLCLFAAESVQAHTVSCPGTSMDVVHHYKTSTSWSPVDILMSMTKPHTVTGSIRTPAGVNTFSAAVESLDLSVMAPWFQDQGFLIKSLEDYAVFTYLAEKAEYQPNYDDIDQFKMIIGNYGIVPAFVPKSPVQAMIMLMGPKQFSLDYYMHRKEFNDLYKVIYKKDLEAYKIAAESPVEVVWGPDNVTSVITSPTIFKEYSLPFYNEVADIIHKHGKIYVVHMDGELKALADLIAQTRIDAIESFTPPPVGNFTIEEARAKWGNKKVIWANFPEPVCLQGERAVRQKTRQMLTSAAPGDDFLMGISEGFPSFLHMLNAVPTILRTINKYGRYPIPTSKPGV